MISEKKFLFCVKNVLSKKSPNINASDQNIEMMIYHLKKKNM